jgi:hypothetical protein
MYFPGNFQVIPYSDEFSDKYTYKKKQHKPQSKKKKRGEKNRNIQRKIEMTDQNGENIPPIDDRCALALFISKRISDHLLGKADTVACLPSSLGLRFLPLSFIYSLGGLRCFLSSKNKSTY